MAKLTGSVDEFGRPVVRIGQNAEKDDLLAIIDTGFNGELMMGLIAANSHGVEINDDLVDVELGNGATVQVFNGLLVIDWLERQRSGRVLVSDSWLSGRADEPVALVGTRLLAPHLLLVDFGVGTVEIETQD